MDKAAVPLDTLRNQIADAIAVHVSAHDVPRICVAVGIQLAVAEGDGSDAFRSKRSYVKRRLLERSREDLLQIATRVLTEFDAPDLQDSLSELTSHADIRISVITRKEVLKTFNAVDNLSGDIDILEFLTDVFGKSVLSSGQIDLLIPDSSLESQIIRHYVNNSDWSNEYLLTECGALTCSQSRFFKLIGKALHPVVRRGEEQTGLAESIGTVLRHDGFDVRQTGVESRYPTFDVVRAQSGVSGSMKNLIFASVGAKPELVFSDAVNNDVEIVKNADKVLIYDLPLPASGQFLWKDLLAWWRNRENIADEVAAKNTLYLRLLQSVKTTGSPGELAIFRSYYERYGPGLGQSLPVLIPQVYLHYDPYTKRERGDEQFLTRQRMDFLLMLENGIRIVLEVDGQHHYSTEDRSSKSFVADPKKYAVGAREDRRLRLLGYEVYRFGASEFSDTTLSPARIGPDSQEVVSAFFDRLFLKYGVLPVSAFPSVSPSDSRPHAQSTH